MQCQGFKIEEKKMQKASTNKNPQPYTLPEIQVATFDIKFTNFKSIYSLLGTPNQPFCTWSDLELRLGHTCCSCCMYSHMCTPVSQGTWPIAPARGPSLGDELAARFSPLRPEMKQWLSVGKWVYISTGHLNFGTKRNAASSYTVTGRGKLQRAQTLTLRWPQKSSKLI